MDKRLALKVFKSGVFLLLIGTLLQSDLCAQSTIDAPATEKAPVLESVNALLQQLDEDYKKLLEISNHKVEITNAEKLLAETNDNTTWTNYSEAIRLLRDYRDKAAVPLLLRYILIHTERSSRHVMIPEYVKTLEVLTGKPLTIKYQEGAELRVSLANQIGPWWKENKDQITVDPEGMDDKSLALFVNNLLSEIRGLGEFTRSRAERETCYVTNQTVHYNLLKKAESSRSLHEEIFPRQFPLVLSACEDQPVFPYEAVWLLSEFCKAGMAEKTHAIASDPKQDLAVRLACWLGMYRAGHAYPSEEMIQLYQQETDFERRLIILASMRWGSKILVPTLLTAMDDKNFEIATAAACSVVKFEVPEALPKIEKLLSVEHESPLLVYNALAELKSFDAKLLLRKLLLDSLEGGANRAHLARLLDAYESAWGVTPYGRMRTSEEVIVRARNGLQFADEAIKKRQNELVKLTANVDSVHEQVKSAEKILELRLSEYRRLSGLLGDEVITADVVQEAKVKLDASRAEMEAVQQNLVDAKARLELLQ